MARIVEVAGQFDKDGMSESQHRDLEMYRKLDVVQVYKMYGATDEECEQAWLEHLKLNNDETLYVAEPGQDAKR